MRIFALFLVLLSQASLGQNESVIINEKMKPLVFQVEKQLASQIKSTLEESLKIKDIAVNTTLRINTALVAEKYNLIPKRSKFLLPGLDESASNYEENLKNFNPTLQDAFLSVAELNVKIGSLIVFTNAEKSDIEKVVTDDLSTLNLKKINYSFYKSKNLEPGLESPEETKSEAANSNLPEPIREIKTEMKKKDFDFSQWLLIGMVALGALLVVAIFVVGYVISKQFKSMASSLSGAISQIDLTPENASINASGMGGGSVAATYKGASVDEFSPKIHNLFSQIKDKKHFYKTFLSSFSAIRFYVICEGLTPDERAELKKHLSAPQYKEYLSFLQSLANGDISSSKLAETGDLISREMSLYLHDADTFVGQTMKNKIRTLNNQSLKHLIEESDEADFMTLAQFSDPVEMSLILNENPGLLEKFEVLEVRDVNADALNAFTSKIEAAHDVPPLDVEHADQLKLREFVPVNVEIMLNQKLGKEKTLWEELDENGRESLYDFTIGLPPKEASMFVSIIPDDLREDVLTHIPDLKREQIRRHGFEVSRRSMELKHEFFQSIRMS